MEEQVRREGGLIDGGIEEQVEERIDKGKE